VKINNIAIMKLHKFKYTLDEKLVIFTEFKKNVLWTYILRMAKKVKVETIHELPLQKYLHLQPAKNLLLLLNF
jgi:nucleosome binding factor SPN SPT16 subunit